MDLLPVTQLYVSVDASTKEGLKKIDRPLFRDFWDRFVASLQALSDKVGELVNFACLQEFSLPSVLWHWWLGDRKDIQPLKILPWKRAYVPCGRTFEDLS